MRHMLLLLMFVIGFAITAYAGYAVAGMWKAATPLAGFCCQQLGSKCIRTPGGINECKKLGGISFDEELRTCESVCSQPST